MVPMGVTTWWRRLTGRTEARGTGAPKGERRTGRAGRADGHHSPDPVRTGRPQPTGRPGRRPRPADLPAAPVLGVHAGAAGCVGALLEASGHGTPHVLVAPTVAELVAQAGPVAVVAVDLPLGLPDEGRREADTLTRRFVGSQASAVVTTPVRDAVYAESYGQANTLNRERAGAGVPKQAYELRRRIMEADAWLRQDLDHLVVEVHPEASFAMMGGTPATLRRRSSDGARERRELLARSGIYAPTTVPHGVATEDLLDACAAAWSAHRVRTEEAHTFPGEPQVFSDGIPAAIHV